MGIEEADRLNAASARRAWVEVDLGAVRHNVRQLRRQVAPAELMAVVKANAYGHGAVAVAGAALEAGAAWLGVALVSEALELRDAGIRAPVLVLSEPPPGAADACAAAGVAVTIATVAGVRSFGAAGRRNAPVPAHLKVDTGMHRHGCAPEELPALLAAALAEPGIRLEGLWSHFAVADDPAQSATTDAQLAAYRGALVAARHAGWSPALRHLANSAGATTRSDARFDLVRTGIEVYGLAPSPALRPTTRALRTALRLRAEVSAMRRVPAGDRVSYGHRWAAPAATTIATLPLGYADGVRRGLSGAIQVMLGGRPHPQVGTITMDQLMIDVGDAPVAVGDVATLLGDPADGEPAVATWADLLGTIEYEIPCGLGARLPRVHYDSAAAGVPGRRLDEGGASENARPGQGRGGERRGRSKGGG